MNMAVNSAGCGEESQVGEEFQPGPPRVELPELAKRLNAAVKGAGKVEEVARRAGVPPRTIYKLLKGQDIKTSVLVALADACGVTIDWLATGRGEPRSNWITARHPAAVPLGEQPDGSVVSVGPSMPMQLAEALARVSDGPAVSFQHALSGQPPAGYVAIPRYNVSASAGSGALPADHSQIVEYLAFNEDYLRTKLHRRVEDLALIEARGDSMEPTIRDSDILTVDIRPADAIDNGRLYVLRVDNELLVKRLQRRLDGSLVVHSDNPRYAPETVPREELDQLHILGQVILVSAPPR